jgi:short-subunit dehydrogenase
MSRLERRVEALEKDEHGNRDVPIVVVPVDVSDAEQRAFIDANLAERGITPRSHDDLMIVRIVDATKGVV